MLPTFKKKKRETERDRETEVRTGEDTVAHRRGYRGCVQERIQRRTGEDLMVSTGVTGGDTTKERSKERGGAQ